jgi:hypothetical protein
MSRTNSLKFGVRRAKSVIALVNIVNDRNFSRENTPELSRMPNIYLGRWVYVRFIVDL